METKRMSATEKEWLVRLGIVDKIISADEPLVTKRIAMVPHGRLLISGASGLIKRFIRDVEKTLNDSDRKVLGRSFMDSTYTIGIRCVATKQNETKRNDEYGIVVPINAIHALLDARKDHCLTCIGTREEARKCPLKKAMDTLPNDCEDKDDGSCPYRDVL